MVVFSSVSGGIDVWGPTAGTSVRVDALGNVVGDSWILSDLSIGSREIVDVRQCFNDMSVIYALGNNQGQCRMDLVFAIFIGAKNCEKKADGTTAIQNGLAAYASNRISSNPISSSITIGKMTRTGFLTGIDIGNLDAEKGICYGTVHFIMELQ